MKPYPARRLAKDQHLFNYILTHFIRDTPVGVDELFIGDTPPGVGNAHGGFTWYL